MAGDCSRQLAFSVMAQTDMLKRYLDAGVAFTQMTQRRAEEIVRDLVKAGEVQTAEAQQRVNELVSQSRENTERLIEMVRNEIRDQIEAMNLATKGDLDGIRRQLDKLVSRAPSAATAPVVAARAPAAAKEASKAGKAPAPAKAAAKKVAAAGRAPAKKAGSKRSPAKKAAAKKR